MKIKIMILCTGNSCRSQMAEAFLKSFDDNLEVYSAGTKPSSNVHPLAVEVMRETGMDISFYKTKSVEDYLNYSFDYLITVCDNAKESCPVFNGSVKKRLHIGFEDPAIAKGDRSERLKVFRSVRDKIRISFLNFYETELKDKINN